MKVRIMNEVKESKKQYAQIEVTLTDGTSTIWNAKDGDWDDYSFDGCAFIVKKNGAWVGIYNFSSVRNIIVR